jgi:hypothetical protein
MPKLLFQPGSAGGPGRPRGSRNKLAEAFLEALYADFQVHGIAAIEAARVESPLGYVRIIAGLMPQKLEVSRTSADMTDDELLAVIRGERDDERALH